jgi:hypothetical protein
MSVQLVYRKPHDRKLKSGGYARVAGSWFIRERRQDTQDTGMFKHQCPMCGAKVRSVRMPNGGWVHFEADSGLRSMKHPCFYIGEDMLQRKDPNTLDLFRRL